MNALRRTRERARREAAYCRALLRHPRTPRAARWLLGCALVYLVSPVDLIPDGIPILGQRDDLLMVPSLVAFALLLIPATVKRECRAGVRPPARAAA